jgi:hypothetical protein
MPCRMRELAVIVDHPLRIVREFGEGPFEPLIFARLDGAVRYSQQLGIFDRFGAILLGGGHIYLSEKRC